MATGRKKVGRPTGESDTYVAMSNYPPFNSSPIKGEVIIVINSRREVILMERIAERRQEPEPEMSIYDKLFNLRAEFRRQREQGKVVIKGKDLEWRQDRQALSRYYSYAHVWPELAVPFWILFQIRVIKHSGKHTHQGGLALYILEGKGYSVVDGVRYDWEKDDLVILPVKPGGCEHQHFNADPSTPAVWQAFIFDIHSAIMGHPLEQKEEVKDWQKGPDVGHRA